MIYTTPCPVELRRLSWYNYPMTTKHKKKRHYNRITPAVIAQFKATEALEGNGSAAVRKLTPEIRNTANRAYQIRIKRDDETPEQFIDDRLQQIAVGAVNRLEELVNSDDESIATRNVKYAIDHIRGQPTKKSISLKLKANIQNVLD
jgi:hypothetical protein